MPEVRLVNVTKKFGEITAVGNVSLQIGDKEYVCVIGPSGCGKTTLIKCVAGVTEPTEGEIYISDKKMNAVSVQDREIGYVFQEIALFPHMNVYENVSYGPQVKGWPSAKTRRLVNEMLNMVSLRDRVKDHPNVLSGGARQKTAIARALSSGSLLLILDEALGSLDAKVRVVLRHELRRMVKDLGLTAIHVTHDQEEAMAIADRIVVMKAGRLVETGTPLELYLHPKNLFTANFVGEANFMVGKILRASSDGIEVKVDGEVLKSAEKASSKDGKVVAAIRPEFISIKKARGAARGWRGKIANSTFMGSMVRYEIQAENGTTIIVKLPFSDVSRWDVGANVNIAFPPKSVLLYPYPEGGLEKEISVG